jgi:hypothetical protein
VRWEGRLIGREPGQMNMTVADGADYKTKEPKPFWSGWWSFKSNGPAVRYEIVSCKATGLIVSTNGPFPPAQYTDAVIFAGYTATMLLPGETVDCDKAYVGTPGARTPYDMEDDLFGWFLHQEARARHEAINGRIARFAVMSDVFRHDMSKHVVFFQAIVVVVQLSLINEGGLWPLPANNF